jgi:hypothetical protein
VNETTQAKCKRVLTWLRNGNEMTNKIGGNPAMNQDGTPVVSTALAVAPNTALAAMNVPDFMQNIPKEELGTELMKQYISPPRLKIVQGQSGQELKREFGESAVVVIPNNVLITPPIDFKNKAEHSEFIRIIPIFFYPEFCDFNPMGVTPYCIERSTNPQSQLGLKCRGQFDKRKRLVDPDDAQKGVKTYMEVLNFICAIWHPTHFTDPVMVSMKSTDFTTGRNWCKLAAIPRGVPCYGQVFELSCSPRKKDKNEWYGWDIRHAATPEGMIEFVQDVDWFKHLRMLHLEYKAGFEEGLLQANYEDDPADPDSNDTLETTASNVKF